MFWMLLIINHLMILGNTITNALISCLNCRQKNYFNHSATAALELGTQLIIKNNLKH